jgi:drug/metabolite transporter (DMT)-like permease
MALTATADTAGSSRATTGIALMTLAMLAIPAVDGFAKYLSTSYSPLFIGWARYAVASLIVLPSAAAVHGRKLFPVEQRSSHLWRTIFLIVSMTLYIFAVARIPLTTAISTFFVAPILAMVLSAVVLKEHITPRKLVSLALGFAGSLVILRPGGTIEPGILFAFAAGVAFAFYLVATRRAAVGSDPLRTLAFQCVVGTLLLTPQAAYSWSTPAWSDLVFFAGLGLFSAVSHSLSIAAFRLTQASTLAPLVYVELIGATLIGYFVFGDVPGAAVIVGAVLIVCAGLVLVGQRSGGKEDGVDPASP